jgi:hypothetical protein
VLHGPLCCPASRRAASAGRKVAGRKVSAPQWSANVQVTVMGSAPVWTPLTCRLVSLPCVDDRESDLSRMAAALHSTIWIAGLSFMSNQRRKKLRMKKRHGCTCPPAELVMRRRSISCRRFQFRVICHLSNDGLAFEDLLIEESHRFCPCLFQLLSDKQLWTYTCQNAARPPTTVSKR